MMTEYWELIPSEALKSLIVTIVQDLLEDANSSDVRQSVIKVSVFLFMCSCSMYSLCYRKTNSTNIHTKLCMVAVWCCLFV